MAIPQDVIDTIKERVNFVEVASEHVELRRSGRHFVGRCPFHNEKTPSFFVREEEGSFHCFGCGKHGSVFNFVMEMRGLSFPEAVRFLGARVGIEVPEDRAARTDDPGRSTRLKLLREVLRCASEIYAAEMARSPAVLSYLESRTITPTTSSAFRLGYAPRAWSFIEAQVRDRLGSRPDVSEQAVRELLLESGLLRVRSAEEATPERTHFDTLRERVIFPIVSAEGTVVAFGGRTLQRDTSAPKYLNTCESPLYVKRKTLYGLDRALQEIRSRREAIVVEGYFDVLSMVQGGFGGTVATCGTALTPNHAAVLRRAADRAIIAFDGDRAGRKAGAQAFETFLNSGLDVAIALFPSDLDPDTAIRQRGADFVRTVLDGATPAVDAFLDWHLHEERGEGEMSPAVLGRVADRFARVISTVANPVEREFLLKRGASRLGSSLESLDEMLRRHSARAVTESDARPTPQRVSAPPPRPAPASSGPPPVVPAEERPAPPPSGGRDSPPRRDDRRAATPASAPQSLRSRQALLRQVVIAALCEPPCAAAFLGIEHLVPVDAPEGAFGARVRRLLEELAESDHPGLGAHIEASSEGNATDNPATEPAATERRARLARMRENLQAMLERHGLGSERLLQIACRQVEVGGSCTESLVEECRHAVRRLGLQGELEILREKEINVLEESERERLAQEKLLTKRAVERLRQGGPKPDA